MFVLWWKDKISDEDLVAKKRETHRFGGRDFTINCKMGNKFLLFPSKV